MSNWQTPKTDWTANDYYNIHIDLNRVEGNLHEIVLILRENGYSISLPETLDWKMTDFPTVSEINRIRRNINTVIGQLSQLPGIPRLVEENSGFFNYQSANDLEKNIEGLKRVLDGTLSLYRHSGEVYCGEEFVLF